MTTGVYTSLDLCGQLENTDFSCYGSQFNSLHLFAEGGNGEDLPKIFEDIWLQNPSLGDLGASIGDALDSKY